MSFPPVKPFNPNVSKVPILGASSGNPVSFQDPNSVASVGANIQAMADQAKADTLYDTPPKKSEGFRNETYSPWVILGQPGENTVPAPLNKYILLGLLGLTLIAFSYRR